MKTTKKLLSFLIAAVMLFAAMPFAVSAEEATVYVGGVLMSDGDYLATGTTSTVTAEPDAETGYAYYKDGVLTLCNYSYSGVGYYYQYEPDVADYYYTCVYSNGDLEIRLEGNNYLENTDEYGECISVLGNLIIDGDNREEDALELIGSYGVYTYGIGSDSTVTVNGGTVYATAALAIAVDAYEANAEVTINGGLLTLDCTENGIYVYADNKAALTVNGGETAALADVVVYSYTSTADITVNRGALYALTNNIAIAAHSEASAIENPLAIVTLNNGDLYAMGAYCGIYADEIYVHGGSFAVAYDSETNPDGALYTGGITRREGLTEIGSLNGSEYGLGDYKIGDINADGTIDAVDYLLVKRYCFGTYDLWGSEVARADINADDTIDAVDYVLVKRICFGTYTSPSNTVVE